MRPPPGKRPQSRPSRRKKTARLASPAPSATNICMFVVAQGQANRNFWNISSARTSRNWHKSRCGMLFLDPHGSLYDNIIDWLAWNEKVLDVPIIPIDLRRDDWIVSYNLLRQRTLADPAVLVDNITDAMAYVWGQGGTNQTPLFARWAGNVLRAPL
ncbi:MAG: hypothetical protein WDM76_07870 [Limisphaerales bacterium]